MIKKHSPLSRRPQIIAIILLIHSVMFAQWAKSIGGNLDDQGYDLLQSSNVRIVIYDMLGRQVRSLVNRPEEPGYKKAIWDGKNHAGIPVSAGIYLYQIQAGEFRQSRKMVLIK
ncbi:MAG TPA: T9SS type A sorting domain-containing protein [Candidatus Marinimicrobia bacterium]|nr:T9SS type A sorting domain-containing protein [Candidatus Neomarinimicrobiota bacterium]